MKLKLIVLFAICLCFSCVKEFPLENIAYDKLVVVDGIVTNENKRHEVTLSYTSILNSTEASSLNPIEGADVYVLDSDGNKFQYEATSPGNYSAIMPFKGVRGTSYQLRFTLTDGTEYESKETILLSSPPISSIYPQFTSKLQTASNREEPGVQFYINSKPENNEQIYFRYEWEETFKVVTPFVSIFGYDLDTREWYRREKTVNECYQTNYSEEIILATTSTNDNNQLSEIPVNFVSIAPNRITSDNLRNRYSIKVKQYAISSEDYNYYQRIKKLEDDTGTLFDQQLGSVIGNIININKSNAQVLGNFEVAGVSEKRAFFNPEDYGDSFEKPPYRYHCGLEEIQSTSEDSLYFYMSQGSYEIISVENVPINNFVFRFATKRCTDCSWFAEIKKPDFWIDE